MRFACRLLYCLLFVTFIGSCAAYKPPLTAKNWPKPYASELLEYCWIEGDPEPYFAPCEDPSHRQSFLQWDHMPLIVTTTDDMAAVLTDTVAIWNKWVGFELFRYQRLEANADIIILKGGPHMWWRGVARHSIRHGKLKSDILIYDSAVGDAGTMAHELGHAVGLAHDPDNWHSIMYPNNRRALPWLEKEDRRLLRTKYLNM